MSNDADPAKVGEIKKVIFEKVRNVLKDHSLDYARSGSQTALRDFDPSTGFWENSILSKPPRWLVHFRQEDSGWVAEVPKNSGSDRLGYYNTGRGNVGAVCARVLPVVDMGATWTAYEDWEWLVIVFFPKPLPQATSADIVSGFSPPNLQLKCKGTEVTPIALHVYSLCSPDSSCTLSGVEMTYGKATQLLKDLFGVSEEQPSTSYEPSSNVG